MNKLLERLNLQYENAWLDECYEKIKDTTDIPKWLTEKFILDTEKNTPILKKHTKALCEALPKVVANPDLVLYAKTLYLMLSDHRFHEEVFGDLKFPEAPEGADTLPYDIFAFFPMLARIRETYEHLLAVGCDKDIVEVTMTGIDGNIDASIEKTGRFSFLYFYFLWCTTFSTGSIFKIGRFSFELRRNCNIDAIGLKNDKGNVIVMMKEGVALHKSGFILGSAGAKDEDGSFVTTFKETDSFYEGYIVNEESGTVKPETTCLDKKEWSVFFRPGDNIISVHIPKNEPFDRDYVENSYNMGREFFSKLYPDIKIGGFMCISWLLATELKSMLKPTSNIISFQNKYIKFPYKSEGLDVFLFVYNKLVKSLDEIDIDTLEETNSLHTAIKNHYRSGKFIHESGGMFPF